MANSMISIVLGTLCLVAFITVHVNGEYTPLEQIITNIPTKELWMDILETYTASPRGCKVPLESLLLSPAVEWDADSNESYALMMIDPDAPNPKDPKDSPYLHWLVVNIPGQDIEMGETLKEYEDPSARSASASGDHRYVFLIYQGKVDASLLDGISNTSKNFDLEKFTKNNNLGTPVAMNYVFGEINSPRSSSNDNYKIPPCFEHRIEG